MRRVHTLQCLAVLFTLAFPGACAGLMKGIVHTSGWLESCPNAKALLLQDNIKLSPAASPALHLRYDIYAKSTSYIL